MGGSAWLFSLHAGSALGPSVATEVLCSEAPPHPRGSQSNPSPPVNRGGQLLVPSVSAGVCGSSDEWRGKEESVRE